MSDNKILGIDIGTSKTKYAYVKKGKKPKILFYKSMTTPKSCYNDGEITDVRLLGGAIKTFLEENKIRPKAISMVINSSQSVLREVTLPKMDKKEISPAIEFQLSQSFPGINQTHTISSKIYEETDDGVFGIAAFCPNRILNTYGDIADEYNLKIKYLDLSSNCICKAYEAFVKDSNVYKNIIFMNMGVDSTQVDVVSDGRILLSRYVEGGGNSIDKIIANNYSVDIDEAEEIKLGLHENITLSNEDYNSFLRLGTIAIEEQLKQSLDFFNYGHPDSKINKIILLGSASRIKGLKEHYEELFNVECEFPVSNLSDEELDKQFIDYLPAIGAAIRE